MTTLEVSLIAASYVLGGFCAAFYLVKLKGGGARVSSVMRRVWVCTGRLIKR